MILSLIRLVRRAVGLIGIALFVVGIGFWLLTHLAPLTDREVFIIIGGSMEPSIPIGSLVVATRTDATTIVVGDVVTIRGDNGIVVTHRVTNVIDLPEGRFFETKGDANQTVDGGLAPARAVIGTADQYIPYAGYARDILSGIPGIVAALAVLGALLLTYVLLEMLEHAIRSTTAEARELVST